MVFSQTELGSEHANVLDGGRSILSLFNSLFILLALPWFRYLPSKFELVIKSSYWRYIIGLPFAFSLVPTISKIFSSHSNLFISELDVYYSLFTLVFLALVLWETFTKRNLFSLAVLSIMCILITLLAQFYKFSGSNVNMILFSSIFKTTLIMIFFALAMSWVRELSENIIPSASKLFLNLNSVKNKNKYEYIAELKGFTDGASRTIRLTPSSYELLSKFIKARLSAQEAWLEIKPKSETRPNKQYDISDHNEVKRLLGGLLDGIFGKNSWTRDQHEIILRDTLFEMSPNRERKIRLRIPPENIG